MSSAACSPSSAPRFNPPRWLVACLLSVFALLIVLARLYTYSEAMERDIAGYAVIAHEMLAGRALYSDLWERKPPLLYATFAVAQLISGYGPGQIFLLNITAALGTLIAVYFAGQGMGGSKVAGLFAAGIWAIVGGDLYTQANQPNAEVFVNVCLTSAAALLLQWPARRQTLAAMVLGVLFSAATLYKQHVVVTCGMLSLAYLVGTSDRDETFRRLREILIAVGMLTGSWAAVAGYFAFSGRFGFFIDTLFRQNMTYAGNVQLNILRSFLPSHLFPDFARWVIAVAGLTVVAGGIDRWRLVRLRDSLPVEAGSPVGQLSRPRVFIWIAWAGGSAITFGLPGKFFEHYYQLWIPVWCVAGGWAAAVMMKENRPGIRLIHRLLLAGAIGCVLGCVGGEYLLPVNEWTRRKYPTDDFIQQRQMGIQLARLLSPGESFYNLGEDTPLYFYSKHTPASGLLYLSPLETGADIGIYEQRLLADLNRSQPDVIVVSELRFTTLRQQPAFSSWLTRHYAPAVGNLGCPIYRLLLRQGSKRILSAGVLAEVEGSSQR